jgi:hypothetical protein
MEKIYKITFSSDLSLQDTFINRLKHFFRHLFPLDHRNYLSGVFSLNYGLKTRVYVLGE